MYIVAGVTSKVLALPEALARHHQLRLIAVHIKVRSVYAAIISNIKIIQIVTGLEFGYGL